MNHVESQLHSLALAATIPSRQERFGSSHLELATCYLSLPPSRLQRQRVLRGAREERRRFAPNPGFMAGAEKR